jgi:hypothetical protein
LKKLLADLVQESTATTGTGTVTLVAMTGWMRFSDRFTTGDRTFYSIRDGNNWEVGFGTVGAGNTLARTQILETLVAGTVALAGTAIDLSGAAIVRSVAPEALLSALWKVEYATVGANSTLVAGYAYGVTANSLILTLPLSPTAGDRVSVFQAAASITGTVINPNGEKINGVSGNMTVDTDEFSFDLVYVSAGYGWKVLR